MRRGSALSTLFLVLTAAVAILLFVAAIALLARLIAWAVAGC